MVLNSSSRQTSATLSFRDSLILALGLLPKASRNDFYVSYLKIYFKSKNVNLVQFNYPKFTQVLLMIQKLTRQGLIAEEYLNKRYTISLSESGIGAFEVLADNYQSNDIFRRFQNIIAHLDLLSS